MKKILIKDKKGNANIILLSIMTVIMGFGMLTIGSYIYYAIASNADAGSITVTQGTSAVGALRIDGNVTNGGGLRITNGAGIYYFEFNTTNTSSIQVCTNINCIIVNVYNTNTSGIATTNLTAAINANASVAAFLTASGLVNTTTLTYNTVGTIGNSVVLTNFVGTGHLIVSGAEATSPQNMYDGVNDVTGQATQDALNTYVGVVFPLFGLAMMLLGFSVILITLRKSFGSGEAR